MIRDDVELQVLEHLRALRAELAALHVKIDAVAARLEPEAGGAPDAAENDEA